MKRNNTNWKKEKDLLIAVFLAYHNIVPDKDVKDCKNPEECLNDLIEAVLRAQKQEIFSALYKTLHNGYNFALADLLTNMKYE